MFNFLGSTFTNTFTSKTTNASAVDSFEIIPIQQPVFSDRGGGFESTITREPLVAIQDFTYEKPSIRFDTNFTNTITKPEPMKYDLPKYEPIDLPKQDTIILPKQEPVILNNQLQPPNIINNYITNNISNTTLDTTFQNKQQNLNNEISQQLFNTNQKIGDIQTKAERVNELILSQNNNTNNQLNKINENLLNQTNILSENQRQIRNLENETRLNVSSIKSTINNLENANAVISRQMIDNSKQQELENKRLENLIVINRRPPKVISQGANDVFYFQNSKTNSFSFFNPYSKVYLV